MSQLIQQLDTTIIVALIGAAGAILAAIAGGLFNLRAAHISRTSLAPASAPSSTSTPINWKRVSQVLIAAITTAVIIIFLKFSPPGESLPGKAGTGDGSSISNLRGNVHRVISPGGNLYEFDCFEKSNQVACDGDDFKREVGRVGKAFPGDNVELLTNLATNKEGSFYKVSVYAVSNGQSSRIGLEGWLRSNKVGEVVIEKG